MNILDELSARGLLQDVTDRDALGALLAGGPVTFYAGYDPTAASLHVGNLVPLSAMRHLALRGHHMIAVVGGATGMVGDPSGKAQERSLLDAAVLAENVGRLETQVRRLISEEAQLLDNATWLGAFTYMGFLRDVGKHITVNYMLAKDSVKSRLDDREQGISYTEFSYMLLQGYDFVHLAEHHGCRLQVGGSDQWGNITCGIELRRKMHGPEAPVLFGLTVPLLLTAAGTKFGKSEKGQNVWLDGRMTSPYHFYQFWLNVADADVDKYLRMFTVVPLEEIAEVVKEHAADPGKRVAHRRLAREVTTWVHGAEVTDRVEAVAKVLFGEAVAGLRDADLVPILGDAPATDVPRAELEAGLPLIDLMVRVGLCASKSEARRLLEQGGAYVNNVKIEWPSSVLPNPVMFVKRGPEPMVTVGDLATETMILLRAGKKKYRIVRAV